MNSNPKEKPESPNPSNNARMKEKTKPITPEQTEANAILNPEQFSPQKEEFAAKEESKLRRFFRKLIRWVIGLSIVFALGFLTSTLTFYQPLKSQLNETLQKQQTAEETIQALTAQVKGLEAELQNKETALNSLQSQNEMLQQMNIRKDTHILLLQTLHAVEQAQISLSKGHLSSSSQYLSQAKDYLKLLSDKLDSSQKENIAIIETRLNLTATELSTDPQSAQIDMDIITQTLTQMEKEIFSED